MLRLPHFLDAELFRLPLLDDGESEQAHAAQRRPDHAQLDFLQFSGAARRRLHAGGGRHGHRTSRRAGALFLRDSGEFAKCESRVALLHAADRFGGRIQRQAFSTFVPHTVRGERNQDLHDCHVSDRNDNNAWMAQVLLQGTNFLNFMGRYIYVADGAKGFDAVAVAEHDEPPAVIGSDLQRMAYPGRFPQHVARERATHGSLPPRRKRSGRAASRRICLRGDGQRRIPRLRRREHRQQGIFRTHGDRAGVSAGPAPLCEDEICDGGGDSHDAGRRSGAHAQPRKRRAEDSPDVRVSCTSRTSTKGWSSSAIRT